MPKIIFLPHHELCPEGAALDAEKGDTVLDVALRNGIGIEHTPAKRAAHAQRATSSCAKASTRSTNLTSSKTTCSTKPGASNPSLASAAKPSSTTKTLVVEIPQNIPSTWSPKTTKLTAGVCSSVLWAQRWRLACSWGWGCGFDSLLACRGRGSASALRLACQH